MQQHQHQVNFNLADNMEPQTTQTQIGRSNGADATSGSTDSADESQFRIKFADWGFKIDRLFEVAYRFYKRNENKAFHPSFDERNKMIALIMQARYGNHDSARAPDIGTLDLVGKRRQYEWSLLNGMTKTEAMSKFICALEDLCPIFKAYAEAVKISSGIEQSLGNHESMLDSPTIGGPQQRPKDELGSQTHDIYTSLCKQTYHQFKSYAEKTYPDDVVKQKYLITSLQEQYYQQYISQMHPELKSSLPNSSQTSIQQGSNIPSSQSSPTASDKSDSNGNFSNDSIKSSDARKADSSIRPENQLTLVPETPYLDLPLPAAFDIARTERYKAAIDSKIKTGEVSSSMGDINCEENGVQADVSSEELNSGVGAMEATSSPPSDDVDREAEINLSESVKSISIESKRNEPKQESIVEPVKLFRNTDLPSIGLFESFPEPRPIKSTSQRATPVDQINPNLSFATTRENKPQKSTMNQPYAPINLDEPSQSDNAKGVSDSNVAQQPAVQAHTTTYHPNVQDDSFTSSGEQINQSREQDNRANDDCQENLPPLGQADGNYCSHTIEDAGLEGSPSPDAMYTQQFQHFGQQGPELWDSMSSNGDHSPVQQLSVPCVGLEPATIWTKREVAEFKESLSDDKQGGIYEVKQSTLVIIQVPTYPDGKYIYWEFATDDFDIGFGLEFVYEKHLTKPLALNIYEDLDEDDMDELIAEEALPSPEPGECQADNLDSTSDANNVSDSTLSNQELRKRMLTEKKNRLANTVAILPTYRRDSHKEVIVGRHKYPGQGYYMLRFDNTYSIMRSKTVYFRICYFM